MNVKTKHVKPRQEGESGQIVKVEAPIHHSQVQLVTADGKARAPFWPTPTLCAHILSQVSRVGKKIGEDGKKFRVFASTGERVPEPPRPAKAA